MRDRQYFVYTMSSASGTLYIGMTNSIYRRALQHKSGEIEGFTKSTTAPASSITNASTMSTAPLAERKN